METAAHGTLKLNSGALRQTKIPLPSLEVQQAIVAEIEAVEALIGANHDLVARFKQKIEQAIAHVWGGAKVGAPEAAAA